MSKIKVYLVKNIDSLEIINHDHPRGGFRFALFDFDGTLSLIREGWQNVMIPMMVDILTDLNTGETAEEIEACVREFVEQLTGKQTIYQMMALCDEISKRGGTPKDPLEYKQQYSDLLWLRIKHRVAGLNDGTIDRKSMMIPGSEDLLIGLKERGVSLFLASGTDDCFVQNECGALGLSKYFDGGIYGAQDDLAAFSKKMVIERIIRDNNLQGKELLGFGDGFVEIENTKEAGGVAIGAAVDEIKLEGVDDWKRKRLISAGADVIVPHYREHRALLAYLFAEE